MGQQEDGAGQIELARGKYETAREWLGFLIDHPDKIVSASEYRAQLRSARNACSKAHAALMAAARG